VAKTIEDVAGGGLCTGCGLCASEFGPQQVTMHMSPNGYLRPLVHQPLARGQQAAFERLCPGLLQELPPPQAPVHPLWGAVQSCQTGWSTDAEVRYKGSSGGALSALLLHLLDSGQVAFVAHVAAAGADPFGNVLHISRNRADVLAGAGSRYGPSAPLAGLEQLFAMEGRFAFVGKPCDVAGLRHHLALHPERRQRVAAVLSFMCAGVPSERATHALVRQLGTAPEQVVRFQYRGDGWPGQATAWTQDGRQLSMDYATSWGTILNRQLQFRCKVCPDGIGEFADVVGADAWYGVDGYPDFEERAGRSLILARTPAGQALLDSAVGAGAVAAEPCALDDIERMQPYQAARKQQMVARLAAWGVRRGWLPRYRGFRLWQVARAVSLKQQLRTFAGTLKRIPGKYTS